MHNSAAGQLDQTEGLVAESSGAARPNGQVRIQERSGSRSTTNSIKRKSEEGGVRRILVATNFSPGATKAVDCAAAMANQCNAGLTILHVININHPVQAGTAEDLMKHLWSEGSTQLGQLAWSLSNTVNAETMLAEGLPWEIMVQKSRDFDLLVLSQNPSPTGKRLFSQHTTQRVVENSCCPVMVIRAPRGG
jgi:nucleotide-binding universal stress UspA family protein